MLYSSNMSINDVAGEKVYHFFWVIILCPVIMGARRICFQGWAN